MDTSNSASPQPIIDYSAYGPDSLPPMNSTRNPVLVDPDARPLPMPVHNTSLQLLQQQNALMPNSSTLGSHNHSVYVIPLQAEANQQDHTTVIDLNQSSHPQQQGVPTSTVQPSLPPNLIQQLQLLPVTTTHDQLQSKLLIDQLKLAEAEARLERDIALKEKRELEKRLAMADMNKVEEAQLETRMAKVNLKRREEEYSSEMEEMMRKVAWYVDNQSFNKAQEDLIKEQQNTIHTLRLKFQELESLVTSTGIVRTDKDKQIKILQKKNLELEETIRSRYPNSIPELIRACQPANTGHLAEVRRLKQRIEDLEGQLTEKEGNYERGISLLRTEADQLRLHYQERIKTMEEEMKLRMMTVQTKKVKELEKQLSDMRRYYTEKLKEQEAMLSNLRRGGAGGGGGSSSFLNNSPSATRSAVLQRSRRAASTSANRSVHYNASDAVDGHLNNSKGEVQSISTTTQTTMAGPVVSERKFQSLLKGYNALKAEAGVGSETEDALYLDEDTMLDENNVYNSSPNRTVRRVRDAKQTSAREALLKKEVADLRALVSSGVLSGMPTSNDSNVTASPLAALGNGGSVLGILQQQIAALQSEIAIHKRLLAEAHELHKRTTLECEDRIADLKQQHRKELALQREESEEEVRRIKRVHQGEMQSLSEITHIGGGNGALLTDITNSTNNTLNNKQSLPAFNKNSPSTAAATSAYLELVTERLHALEHRQKLRELQVAKEVAEIKRLSEFEIQSERQKRTLLIEEKNREILRFRGQIDMLLEDLGALRATQSR